MHNTFWELQDFISKQNTLLPCKYSTSWKLGKLVVLHKNWSKYPRLSYKGGPKSMANLIELEENLAKVLKEEFEGALEDEFDAHDW